MLTPTIGTPFAASVTRPVIEPVDPWAPAI